MQEMQPSHVTGGFWCQLPYDLARKLDLSQKRCVLRRGVEAGFKGISEAPAM